MILCRLIKECLTEDDNQTYDHALVLAALSVLVGLGLAVYSVVWRGQAFDFLAYGGGVGALFAGVGAQLKLRKTKEPTT